MKKNGLALLAAVSALGLAAAPAAAATFTMTGGAGVNGTYGLSDTFAAGGINVRVSAWHAVANAGSPTYTVSTAYLGEYGSGLGATAVNDSNGTNNLHTVDNDQGVDFLLFQFDRLVKLTGADLTPFAIGSSTDNDASVAAGITALPWTSKIDLVANSAFANTMINGAMSIKSSAGTPTARSFSAYGQVGNAWIIAADFKNLDGIDGFKVNNLAAIAAVPEPASWAMMVAGFGLLGWGARRRSAVRGTVIA